MKIPIIGSRAAFTVIGASLLFLVPVTAIHAETFAATGIASGSITTSKLGFASVTTKKIRNLNVTSEKLANGSVTLSKIASNIGVWLANGSDVYLNGNVGIGTNTPSSKLDVIGTVSASALRAPGAGVNTGTFAFIHKATLDSLAGNTTAIDNVLSNNDPGAIVIVTHNWTSDTSASKYLTDVVGVYYSSGRWKIFTENAAFLQVGDAFNVMVIKP